MKVPGIKCENNHWNDLSLKVCHCGKDLSVKVHRGQKPLIITSQSIALVDLDMWNADQIGTFNQELPVYEQTCSRCNTVNYKYFENTPQATGITTEYCISCFKRGLKQDGWKLYGQEELAADSGKTLPATAEAEPAPDKSTAGGIRGKIMDIQNKADGVQADSKPQESAEPPQMLNSWGAAIRSSSEKKNTTPQNNSVPAVSQSSSAPILTLEAIVGGTQTIELQPKETEAHVLGREAKFAGFLEQDEGVSRYHCSLYFQNGEWHVVDFHSTNGTLVNGQRLTAGLPRILKNSDTLCLGSQEDSIAFRLLIK